MSAASSSDDAGGKSIIDSVASKASDTFSSLQIGVASVFSRLNEGETVLSIVNQGINSGLDSLNSQRLISNVRRTLFHEDLVSSQTTMALLSVQNPIFKSYAICAGVLGAKLTANSAWTAYNRVNRKVFATPEDVAAFGGAAVNNNDPVVERIRRMHLNDVENYTPFFILGLIYVTTEPCPTEANILFRVFVAARLLHTACYMGEAQPGRFLAAIGGWGVNIFMAYRIVKRVL